MRECFANAVYGSHRHPGGIERLDPFRLAARAEDRVHLLDQQAEIGHAIRIRRKAWIVAPLGMAEHVRDAFPVGLVRAADVDPSILRVERLVRCGQDMRRSGRARRLARRELDRRVPVGLLQRRLISDVSTTCPWPVFSL